MQDCPLAFPHRHLPGRQVEMAEATFYRLARAYAQAQQLEQTAKDMYQGLPFI